YQTGETAATSKSDLRVRKISGGIFSRFARRIKKNDQQQGKRSNYKFSH
ncbi:MAG: hypothetical protein ACI9VN_001404, partial [Patescibacteria group bacterium]